MFKRPSLGKCEADLLSLMNYSTDRENAVKAMKMAGNKKREHEIEFRLVWPDGQVRLIAARGRFFYNQGQNLLLGVFIDVTAAARHHAADFPATKKVMKRTQG